ncbi:MAG: PKD domain-containing protein [Chitinophagales bacterium]
MSIFKFNILSRVIISLLLIIFLTIGQKANSQVSANFSSDTTDGCLSLELVLINNSTGATSYYWEVYDPTGSLVGSSTLFEPVFFLYSVGDYTVTLTATGSGGSTDILTIPAFATVHSPPTASISASDLEGCAPFTTSFSNTSIPGSYGAISSYYWVIFGSGTLPSDPTLTYTFDTPGTYYVYLFIEDDAGCEDFATVEVTVYDWPEPSFTSTASISCATPLNINFTNTSTGVLPLTYLWDFGDGATSVGTSPSHNYTSYGSYDVSLTVTDNNGCIYTEVFTDYVQINASPIVNFIPSETIICDGEEIFFDNLSGSSTGSWLWNFGDGSTSTLFEPSHIYPGPGVYTVSLDADFGGGCSGSISFVNLITVEEPPLVTYTYTDPSSVCETPFSVSFTPTISGSYSTVLWSFEDDGFTSTSSMLNPTYTWNQSGDFDVSITVSTTGGCISTYSLPDLVTIGELDLVLNAFPPEGCFPLTTTFSATGSEALTTYLWNFWDGTTSTAANPTHLYSTVGCTDVSLIASSVNGCSDTVYINDMICVGDTLTALLVIPDSSCPGVMLEVDYLPLDSITAIIDGGLDYASTSPVSSSTVITLPPGDHTVDYITWNNGCTDTISSDIHILDVDDSNLSVTYNCTDPYTVELFIDPVLADSSCGWLWDFGDGTTDSISLNPTHTYSAAGTYHVTVTYYCITPDPCQGLGIYVTIKTPVADFIAVPEVRCYVPGAIYFSNFSTDGISDAGLTYQWDFGDGYYSTLDNPTHTYFSPGQFIVELTITDSRGCTAFTSDTVYLSSITASLFTPDYGGCLPFDAEFSDLSVSSGADISSWTINWDDGTIDTFYSASDVDDLTHTYSTQNYYNVTMTVINELGCIAYDTVEIIASQPFADFYISDTIPCLNEEVFFYETVTGYDIDYSWEFGDGSFSTDSFPSHSYSDIGSYPVTLTVTDINGCTDSKVFESIVSDTVLGEINSDILISSCNYALVQFFVESADSLESFEWDFGDGYTSSEAEPIHAYISAGEYTVSVIITNTNGCSGEVIIDGYTLVPGPYGNISISDDSLCIGDAVSFYLNGASIDTVSLFFGDGNTYNADILYTDVYSTYTIPYIYSDTGTFYISAYVTDSAGCSNIFLANDTIEVGGLPTANYFVSELTICTGQEITFTDSSSGPDELISWFWDLGDLSISSDSSSNYNHVYTNPGVYNTSLTVETIFGCTDEMEILVTALEYPDIMISPDTTICPGLSVSLSAYADGAVSYTWSPTDSLSATNINDPIASPITTTTYTVIADNGYCTSDTSTTISVINNLINAAGSDADICIGDTVSLFVDFTDSVNEGFINYVWSPSTFLSDSYSLDPYSIPTNDISYTVEATCGNLIETYTAYISVNDPPVVNIIEDSLLYIIGQDPLVLNTTVTDFSSNTMSYAWMPDYNIDCNTCSSVNVSPNVTTLYSVIVTNQFGCSDTDFAFINVKGCEVSLFAIPNLFTPNNDGFNDVFSIKYEGLESVSGYKIFDRLGGLIFSTNDPYASWDGTSKGKLCNQDVYVYSIEAVCLSGEKIIAYGNLTLLR